MSNIENKDIKEYLKENENKELLRFITCGSVDDGKSTLIGRLLHDSKMIYEDQLASIKKDSKKSGTTGDEIDLALLVDGLASEREQGITIDVAYRYFSTDKRKFIIADTPGHEQYTRNMATGASTANLAIILIDARYGLQTQTKRHSFIAKLLGIKNIIVAINKMDLVDFSEDRFFEISTDYLKFAKELGLSGEIKLIPISALNGDNVVNKSESTPWYSGDTLLHTLETIEISKEENSSFRFPVQYVNRPNLDFRGFCGTVASGEISIGDTIVALPSGKSSKVKDIIGAGGLVDSAYTNEAITITLEDEIDISRGDIIVKDNDIPDSSDSLWSNVVWLDEEALSIGREYYFKLATKKLKARVEEIEYKVDVNTLEKNSTDKLSLNEVAKVKISLDEKVAYDSYETNKTTGSFIIVDRYTNNTVGAGMIISKAQSSNKAKSEYSEFELELNALVTKHFPHWGAKDLLKG
jgi:sulfate adenylyltransferase subunit 1